MSRGGYGKNTSKLQRLLRQDHSDVYFNNEKLNDQLNSRIDHMQRDMHRHDIQRGIEIKKLKREIHEARSQQPPSHCENVKGQITVRPHTAVGFAPRVPTAGVTGRKRAQSAWARTGSTQDIDKPPERAVTPESTVSTLQNVDTLRRYKNIDANWFKENNRFPEEWYIKCLPASDAAIHNARKKTRSKSAHANFGFLAKIREREMTERNLQRFSNRNKKRIPETSHVIDRDSDDSSHDSSGSDEPAKPSFMSRRRLMEITKPENKVERGPSRDTERKLNVLIFNRQENERIFDKVRLFCKLIEERKARELLEMKEREEAWRREAQEREYLKNVDETLEVIQQDMNNTEEQTVT